MMDGLQAQRLTDFQQRAGFAPDNIYRHKDYDWPYIPIHPFADDVDTLRKLNIARNDCWGVDAWCVINHDATLLQVSVGRHWPQCAGLYARQTVDELEWVYLVAIIDHEYITRATFEHAMLRFFELGYPSHTRFDLDSAGGLVRIGAFNCT